MIRLSKFIITISLIVLALCACEPHSAVNQRLRKEFAEENQGDIVVGIPWSLEDNAFTNLARGADMAVAEINRSERGVFKYRKIRLVKEDDEYLSGKIESVSKKERLRRKRVRDIARGFVDDPSVIAVVGHRSSDVAIPASAIYSQNNVVYIAPSATNIMLTAHNFDNVFRLIPNNDKMGAELADYCREAGYKNMAVLNARNTYAEELANAFIKSVAAYEKKHKEEENAVKVIKIVFVRSFFSMKEEFSQVLADLKEVEENGQLDAVFVVTPVVPAGKLIFQARGMGIKAPFIGGDALYDEKIWQISKGAAQGLVVPSVWNENDADVREFKQKYQAIYGSTKVPGQRVALGYDAMYLLAAAIDISHSTSPEILKIALRFMPPWTGVMGQYRFDKKGDVKDKKLYLKILCDGHFKETNPSIAPRASLIRDARGRYNVGPACEEAKPPSAGRKDIKGKEGNITTTEDKDKDGITDREDVCPTNTVEERAKGVIQTGTEKGCPLDTDKDNVPDYKDKCEQTPPTVEIDKQGCPFEFSATFVLVSEKEKLFAREGLTPEGLKLLEQLFQGILEENKIMVGAIHKVDIVGHTDSVGSEERNQEISVARAKKVADYLISRGIQATQINFRGEGEKQSIESNDSEMGRNRNRRIEVKLILFKNKPTVVKTTQEPQAIPEKNVP